MDKKTVNLNMNPFQKPYLRLLGTANEKVVKRLLPGAGFNTEEAVWFFADFANSSYPVGTFFDIMINGETHRWSYTYKMELTRVTDQLGGLLNQIEKGYKTICELKFSPKIPGQIKLLSSLSDWDIKEHSLLIARHQDIEILGPVANAETTFYNYEELIIEKMASSNKKYFTLGDIAFLIPHHGPFHKGKYRHHVQWLASRLISQGRLKEEGKERFALAE